MIDLPEGWRKTGPLEGWRLSRFLRRKISPDHVLATLSPKIVALHQGGHEFLATVRNAQAPYYVIHVLDRDDQPNAFPIMDTAELGGADAAEEEYLEDSQIFLLEPEPSSTPLAIELWVNPVAPVSCEKILIYSGGSFIVVPLIGESADLAQGCSLTIAKSVLGSKGYVQVDGPTALALMEEGRATHTGQALSLWMGSDQGERAIWSVLETPGEEFSMQRVDGDRPSVLFFSNLEATENALRNRNCVLFEGRMTLDG